VIAPGTKIVAAKGFGGLHDPWIAMSGTSMAAPIVCGVAAQMLAVNSKLTAPQISGIMIRTSKPVPGTDYHWKDDLGFGVVDAQACVAEAKQIEIKKDLKK
jgi:subtilisin family serine protease